MSTVREDEIKNQEFNLWDAYDEIKAGREFIYSNMFDIDAGETQDNLKIVYEKVGVFLQVRTTDERCVKIINALMKEVKKIISDFVPLKKIYQIDNNPEKIEKVSKEVEVATRHIRSLVSDILESLVENKKKHLSQICSRYLNADRGGERSEEKVEGGTRIWSGK